MLLSTATQTLLLGALIGHSLAASNTFLHATAIVTNAHNHSALECWQFTTPATISADAGTSGAVNFAFSQARATEYTQIPARFDGGTHNAPAPQLVTFLSGLAHVTLPAHTGTGNSSLDEAWVLGGANGLLVAVDMVGSGHITTYPSDQPSVSLQTRFDSLSDLPAHRVVSQGPCHFHVSGGQFV